MQRHLLGSRTGPGQTDAVRVEQARLLYAGLPGAIIVNTVLALILVSVQSAVIPKGRLWGWLALIGVILLARTALAVAWHAGDAQRAVLAASWIGRFRIGVIATGLAWGTGVVLLFPVGDRLHEIFLALVLAGLSAGAVTSLAVDRVSTVGFLVPALIPLVARFAMEGDKVSLAIGTMVVVFFLAIVANAARAGGTLLDNFVLRIDAVERERVLRQSEARLNQAQRSAHIGYWELDLIEDRLYWSDETYRIFEMYPEAFCPSYEAFLNAIHPDDRKRVNQAYMDSLTTGEPYDIVHRLHLSEGRTRFVRERCETQFDSEGKAIRSLGTVQDVTQQVLAEQKLHESEKKYRSLFENSRDALMTLAPPSWKFTSANGATLKMFCAASEAEFACLKPWDISPERQPDGPLSAEKAREMIETALRHGSNFFEWTHKRLDGRKFPAAVLLSRLDQDGQVTLQATVRDITNRKRLEQEVRERRAEMDALQKSQVAALTAAAIAHELNQPLLAVASYSEAALLLMDSKKPDLSKLREAVEGSERQALRAGQSLRDLLKYLSIKEVSNEAFDLKHEIVDVLNNVRAEHGLPFRSVLDLEESLPQVQANRTHVQKALFNLVYNGVESMQQANVQEPTITVTACAVPNQNIAQVTVQDNGPGLKSDGLERLFEPFFTTKAKGIGMGLAISRSLIEANGGQLWVDPQQGPGATFHLTLPFAT